MRKGIVTGMVNGRVHPAWGATWVEGRVRWVACRECRRVHPVAAPHLAPGPRRLLAVRSLPWPYLVPAQATRSALRAAAVQMRTRREAEAQAPRPSRCVHPEAAKMTLRLRDPGLGPSVCRVLSPTTGRVVALIDPLTRKRLAV